jgi:hypothetical protein
MGSDPALPKKTQDLESALTLLNTDDDFVAIKRFDFSLARLLERYPDGAPNSVIASALMIDEEDVEPLYESIVNKLREIMQG